MFNSVNDNTRISSLVEKLRRRLKNFVVIDRQGEKVGEVNDFILDDNRQLTIVVSQFEHSTPTQLFLINSKLIQKIEPANKTVSINIDKAEIRNFTKYMNSGRQEIKLAKIAADAIKFANESSNEDTISNSERLENTGLSNSTKEPSTPVFKSANLQDEIQEDTNLESFEAGEMLADVQGNTNLESAQDIKVLGEEIIRLLGERVVVERTKRKVGEVIVRKEIETRIVQVPVRYEKLIVEQVSPEHKQLAEINLGQEALPNDELPETVIMQITDAQTFSNVPGTPTEAKNTGLNGELTVSGKFNSPKTASLLLNAIALERNHGCQQVRVEIVVEDAEQQKTYQEWFNRTLSSS